MAEDAVTTAVYTIDILTSVSNVNIADVCIYPNPFSNELTIISDEVQRIEVYNIFGQKLLGSEVNNNTVVNTSELACGVYVVKCLDASNDVIAIKRLLKK
jgi:hypothetical protein